MQDEQLVTKLLEIQNEQLSFLKEITSQLDIITELLQQIFRK